MMADLSCVSSLRRVLLQLAAVLEYGHLVLLLGQHVRLFELVHINVDRLFRQVRSVVVALVYLWLGLTQVWRSNIFVLSDQARELGGLLLRGLVDGHLLSLWMLLGLDWVVKEGLRSVLGSSFDHLALVWKPTVVALSGKYFCRIYFRMLYLLQNSIFVHASDPVFVLGVTHFLRVCCQEVMLERLLLLGHNFPAVSFSSAYLCCILMERWLDEMPLLPSM